MHHSHPAAVVGALAFGAHFERFLAIFSLWGKYYIIVSAVIFILLLIDMLFNLIIH
jgi:hypothetical protein